MEPVDAYMYNDVVKASCIIMKYRTGALYSLKRAVCLTSMTCLLCPQLHILSGCRDTHTNKEYDCERHGLACSVIMKAISKTGPLLLCLHGYGQQQTAGYAELPDPPNH